MKWRKQNFKEKILPRLTKDNIKLTSFNIIKERRLNKDALMSNNRQYEIVIQRHILAYELRKAGFTLMSIARFQNRKHYTTIINSITAIENLLSVKDSMLKPYYPEIFGANNENKI